MLRNYKLTIFLTSCAALCFYASQFSSPTQAQQSNENSEANPDQPALERPEILKRQSRLARQYDLLEEKLFTLYGYERDKNPTRSKLLEKAFRRSQSSATNDQLKEVVALIESAKLPRAQEQQEEVLNKLKDLLALLQSEDRSKRLKDEIERYQEYLKEVEKLLRLQKGLRGQAEGGGDAQRIAKSESQAAERAGKLSLKTLTGLKTKLPTANKEHLTQTKNRIRRTMVRIRSRILRSLTTGRTRTPQILRVLHRTSRTRRKKTKGSLVSLRTRKSSQPRRPRQRSPLPRRPIRFGNALKRHRIG